MKHKKAPKPRALKSGAEGEITTGEAAIRYGYDPKTLSMLKKNGKLTGRYGHIDVSSIEKYIAQLSTPGRKSPKEKKAKAPKAARKKSDEPAGAWDPANVAGQTYKPLTWIAKELELSKDQVEEIVHNGDIHGSDSHANWDQIQAYMKHPSFMMPEPVEA